MVARRATLVLVGLLALGAVRADNPAWFVHGVGRISVVSPEPASKLPWLDSHMPPGDRDIISPATWAAQHLGEESEKKLCILLVDRSRLGAWPAAAQRLLPIAPETLPADQVTGAVMSYENRFWEIELVAPDATQLAAALDHWWTVVTPYPQELTTKFTWRVPQALGVCGDEARAAVTAWLAAQRHGGSSYAVRVASPARVTAEELRSAALTLTALSYREARALDEGQRELLRGLLPESVGGHLTDDDGCVRTGVRHDGERRDAGVLAPGTRWLGPLLRGDQREPPALPTAEADGGTLRLADLRGVHRVLVIGLANHGASSEAAQFLGQRVQSLLGPASGWQVVDHGAEVESVRRRFAENAASGQLTQVELKEVDALVLVRLNSLNAGVRYHAGAERCVTTRPPAFSQTEPAGPHPDDRVLGIFPRYPRGREDPAYARDYHTWVRQHAEWERARADWFARYGSRTFDWEQELVKTVTVQALGQLDVCDRAGTVLATVPLSTSTRQDLSEVRHTTVTGPTNRPQPLSPPADSDYLPAAARDASLDLVARAAQAALLSRVLVPADQGVSTGAPATPSLATAPPTPDAERPSEATEWEQVVTVTGRALDGPNGEALARADALNQAISQTLGVFVRSDTLVSKAQVLKDTILARASGFASVRAERQREVRDGTLFLTVDVAVRQAPLREAVLASGLVRSARVMVVVNSREGQAVETALLSDLLAAGLKVVDAARSRELRARNVDLAHLEGNAALARELATTYGADLLVTGQATCEAAGRQFGQPNVAARAELKAVDLASGELLFTNSAQGSRYDQTEALAAAAALSTMAHHLSRSIVDKLFDHLQPAQAVRRVTVSLRGLEGVLTVRDFKAALKQMPGVTDIRQLEFREGLLQLEVEVTGVDAAADGVAEFIEGDPAMKRFAVKIAVVSGLAVEGRVRP